MLRILHDTHYDFIKWWRPSLIIRALFIGTGLLLLAFNGIRWSLEFTGGTEVQVHIQPAPNPDAVRRALATAHLPGAEIQPFGSRSDYMIRAPSQPGDEGGNGPTTRALVQQHLQESLGNGTQVEVVGAEHVGPTVGAQLRRNAAVAMAIAFLVTLVYLAIRFEWRFGLAAVVANMHEVLATFAFISIMGLEFSPTVLAAILTVIGYSLNDTIIIFDRVREDLRKRRREPLYDTLNRAINETLPRSVLTHATVLATALALLVFAGPILRPFAWIMCFGVITATFTSIYVSGGLLLWINHTWPPKAQEKTMIVSSAANVSSAGRSKSTRRAAS